MQSTTENHVSQPSSMKFGWFFWLWIAFLLSGIVADVFQSMGGLMVFLWFTVIILGALILRWKNLKTYFLLILLVCTFIAVTVEHVPAKCAFAFAKRSLVEMKAQIDVGQAVALPQYAGFYQVVESKQIGSQVCLWVKWPNPSGRTGFVYREKEIFGVNIGSAVELGDGWCLISED